MHQHNTVAAGVAAVAVAVVLLVLAQAPTAHATVSNCLYLSHQNQHEVMVYKPKPGALPPSTPSGKVYPDRHPTGLAVKENVLYVATYGDMNSQPPSITKYDTTDLHTLGTMKTGPELGSCFPEGLAIDGGYLYVGCGNGARTSLLKYDLATEQLVKVLAKGFPAVFGVTVRDGYVYFASHCTSERVGNQVMCTLEQHDKIFRVPVDGTPDDVTPFAFLEPQSDGEWREAGWTGLSFGPNGNLYAASSRKNDVFMFDSTGQYLEPVVIRHLERASDVVFGPDGWGYVGNPGRGRVSRFNPSNKRQGDTFAEPGPDIVDSGITYLLWSTCPSIRPSRDEL